LKGARAILYSRVSTNEQTTSMQLESMREYCKQRDWIVVEEISETISGAATTRPRRAQLLKQAARPGRKFDTVVVWKLDRWTRSTADLLSSLVDLNTVGVTFVSMTEGFDLSTPQGKLMAKLLSMFAEFEREIIQERVKTGIERHREKNGGKWGRPPTSDQKRQEVKSLFHDERMGYRSVQDLTGLSLSTIYRILRD